MPVRVLPLRHARLQKPQTTESRGPPGRSLAPEEPLDFYGLYSQELPHSIWNGFSTPHPHSASELMSTIGCPKKHFFKIELSSLNHPCHWVIGGHKKNFSVIDSKMTPVIPHLPIFFLHMIRWPYGPIWPYGHFGPYGHWTICDKYGQVRYPWKELQKCSSAVLTRWL